MLQSGAKYWAAALGVVVAAGAAAGAWHYRDPLLRGFGPTPSQQAASAAAQTPAPAAPAPAAASPTASRPPAQVASKPASAAPAPEPEPTPPQFDIVRVEPSGEAVIAGRAAPKAKVTVTDHGQVVAETTADDAGEFTVLPPAFSPGGHSLGLTASVGRAKPVASSAEVAVEVPQPAVKAAPAPKSRVAGDQSDGGLACAVDAGPTPADRGIARPFGRRPPKGRLGARASRPLDSRWKPGVRRARADIGREERRGGCDAGRARARADIGREDRSGGSSARRAPLRADIGRKERSGGSAARRQQRDLSTRKKRDAAGGSRAAARRRRLGRRRGRRPSGGDRRGGAECAAAPLSQRHIRRQCHNRERRAVVADRGARDEGRGLRRPRRPDRSGQGVGDRPGGSPVQLPRTARRTGRAGGAAGRGVGAGRGGPHAAPVDRRRAETPHRRRAAVERAIPRAGEAGRGGGGAGRAGRDAAQTFWRERGTTAPERGRANRRRPRGPKSRPPRPLPHPRRPSRSWRRPSRPRRSRRRPNLPAPARSNRARARRRNRPRRLGPRARPRSPPRRRKRSPVFQRRPARRTPSSTISTPKKWCAATVCGASAAISMAMASAISKSTRPTLRKFAIPG